jgi:hypothetical protein
MLACSVRSLPLVHAVCGSACRRTRGNSNEQYGLLPRSARALRVRDAVPRAGG